MSFDLRLAIVRILNPRGTTVGTGFILSEDGLVATCAHVVEAAGTGPGDTVSLVFHTTGQERQAIVEPESWRGSDAEDVAILHIEGKLPKGVQPLPLGPSADSKGHSFETFGFPEASPEDGILGAGEILGETAIWGVRVLQLRSPEVTPGFSGAPVWDQTNRQVIGMVTAIARPDAYERLQETAFIIPMETLREMCPSLQITGRRIARERVPLFYNPTDFETRLGRGSTFKYALPLVGRTKDLTASEEKLSQPNVEVLVLHGSLGVGKTKLALELAKRLQNLSAFSDCDILFVRETAETVENHWYELNPERQFILFIDDAHHFSHLSQLAELRVNQQLTAGTKFVLITSTLQKQAVVRELDVYAGVYEHEVTCLTPRDIDVMLMGPPFEVKDEDVRRSIAWISGGNPLFAQIGLQVVRSGESLRQLPRNEVLARYIDTKLHDIEQVQPHGKHRAYLSILAGLRGVEWTNEPLRKKVRETLSLTEDEEEALVTDLQSTGLVTGTREWDLLRITPDLISIHILISDYFEPKTRRYDFWKHIALPFRQWRAQDIVSNLADAESAEVSDEPRALLDWWIAQLESIIEQGNSVEKCSALETLALTAYQRPDDVLRIVDVILEGPESEDVSVPSLFGDRVVGQPDVLKRVEEILEKTCRFRLDSSLDCLFKLSTYKRSDDRFVTIRQKAEMAITHAVSVEPKKPFSIYELALDQLSNWLEENGSEAAEVAVLVLRGVYRMAFSVADTSPLDINVIEIRTGTFHPHQAFRRVRDRAIVLLKEAYSKADTIATQVALIDILDGTIAEFHQASRKGDSELKAFLAEELEPTAEWLAALLETAPPLPVRAAIWDWAHRVRHFGRHDSPTVPNLIDSLSDDRQFEFYRALVEVAPWDLESNRVALKEREAKRQEYLQSFLNGLTIKTIEQTTAELARVVVESQQAGREGHWNIWQFMLQIGCEKPDCALTMIAVIESKYQMLKRYLGHLLSGMAAAGVEDVEQYVVAWRESGDHELQAAVARALQYIEGELFISTLDVLIGLQDDELDQQLIPLLVARAAEQGDKESVVRLKHIATRASEATLNTLATSLHSAMERRENTPFKLARDDFLDLVGNLKRLQSIGLDSFDIDICLVQAVYLAPDRVLDWLEERIERELELRLSDKPSRFFLAVPLAGARFLEVFQKTAYYPTAIRRVRDWCLRDQIAYRQYGWQILKAMCPGIGPVLRQALSEWIQDDDEEKLMSAIAILNTFNEGPQAPETFYDLVELTLLSRPGRRVQSILASVIRPCGTLSSSVYQDRLNRIRQWLSHDESRVRRFAQQQVAEFERLVARERQLEANLQD